MYVADTHALIWYILKRAPEKITKIFKKCEAGEEVVYIPTIVLAEIFHAVLREKIIINYDEMLGIIEKEHNYKIIGFDYPILKEFVKFKGLNIHDHIIVATAKFLGAVLMTKDEEIKNSKLVETIW